MAAAEEPRANALINILVVDDRAPNRTALRAILSSPDYRIIEAGSGREALSHLLKEEFAVLLIDVVMPGMDGFELAAMIKQRQRVAAVPILFLTAQATDVELVYKGYGAGAVDYLVKPLVPQMVRAKVAVFAELYRQRKQIEEQAVLLVDAERNQTALRVAELRLAAERRYRNLAEAIPHIVWTASPDGRVDYVNQRWFEYTGISIEQAAESWSQAVHPDDMPKLAQGWQQARDLGGTLEVDCRLRRADTDIYRWYLCRAVPERDVDGQIASWLGTFTDIEDRRHTQEILAEFKGTLDAVLDAVVIFEPDSLRLLYMNRGAELLWGYEPAEMSRMRPFDLMSQYDELRFHALLAPLMEGRESRVMLEASCRRKGASEIPVEFSFQLVRTGSAHIVSIARDITQRKLHEREREHLYDEALAAISTRDEFLSVASHELKTPLSSLRLLVEMLLRPSRKNGQEAPSAEQVKAKLDVAARQIDRLGRLVSELMDVTRITTGQLYLEFERVDLAALARESVARFKEDAARAKCSVTVDAAAPIFGCWDRLRLEQALTNLLGNAFKFGAGSPVEVVVRGEGSMAQLVVRDHGIGVAAEDNERIFQRFERTTSSRKQEGLGLGLYIVREIASAHGGTISVESEPGAGSAFVLQLPREAPARASTLEGSRAAAVDATRTGDRDPA